MPESLGTESFEALLFVLVAALAGLGTSLAVESYKRRGEGKRLAERLATDKANRELRALRKFLATAPETGQLQPIGLLLVSTPHADVALPRSEVPREAREFRSPSEIAGLLEAEESRVLFSRSSANSDTAWVWRMRESVHYLDALTTLGRNETNDVILESDLVSRLHVVIRCEGKSFVAYNMSLTNPLRINDEVVSQAILRDGDVLEVGAYLVELRLQQGAVLAKRGA